MKPYEPVELPLKNLDYQRLFSLVGDANAELALLKQLREKGILTILRNASGRRSAVLCFPELLNIVEGRKVL